MPVEIQDDCVGMVLRYSLVEPDANNINQPVDLTSATVTFNITNPNGTEVARVGAVYGSATNGVTSYTTVSGDFDDPGDWGVGIKASLPSSRVFYSELDRITVKSNVHRP